MSAALQDHLDAVGRLLEISAASEDPVFRDYASHVSSSLVAELDVAAIARRMNTKILSDYRVAVGELAMARRAVAIARGRE